MNNLAKISSGIFALSVLGCVVVMDVRAPFDAQHEVKDISTLQIQLPETQIHIEGKPSSTLAYKGAWLAVGGTKAEAKRNAELSSLRFETVADLARLHAEIPLDASSLVELEMGAIDVPENIDLEIQGSGDTLVNSMTAYVSIDLEEGDVELRGAGGAVVYTGSGDVDVTSSGHVDIVTEHGAVVVQQMRAQSDVYVSAGGDVVVELVTDLDVEFVLSSDKTILVDTPQVTSFTSGSYLRTLGSGGVTVQVVASGSIKVVSKN